MKKLFASLISAKKSNLGLNISKYLIFAVKDKFNAAQAHAKRAYALHYKQVMAFLKAQ
jgi:hypothetical protein